MTQQKPRSSWLGQTVGGRYQIESQLGQGGMSAVYKATDPNLQRTVAVKLIHSHLSSDAEFVRRFEQEAAAVAQLRHPNIIQVYDFNHDNDLYYMVLEYVPGETLQERLKGINKAGLKMPLDDALKVMATTCQAVGYAHEQGMIHRDLKPANVMLNPKGDPILMDFGVAKMLGAAQHTATGAIIGTAKYMSPEQARGERPDERTDLYSLGVMLYEMVTGMVPFDADSTVALLMKHVNEPMPDIREVNKDVPDNVVAVIRKALAKDRKERFQTANEMAAALRACLQAQTAGQAAEDATILAGITDTTAIESAPAKKGGVPGWAIGAAAVVVVLLLAAGAFFMFSGSDDSGQNEEPLIASANTQPTTPSSEGMIRIPAGTYTVGTENAGSTYAPIQEINLPEFWIDQYEVSNAGYAQFLTETDREAPTDWPGDAAPTDEENHPVDNITWADATAYCAWAGKRLPTEGEWEVAARGSEGRLFPWGNNQSVVPLPQSGTYPVGGKPTNQSSFGVFDMAGNVWEWVGEPYAPIEEGHQVLRGGANGFLQNMVYRLEGAPETPTMIATAGIRCAASDVEVVEDKTLAEGVLATDDFSDPGSGWPILTEGAYLFGYHPPAFYHVQVNSTNDLISVSRDPALNDFTVETDVQVASANTTDGNFRYGLAVRRTGNDQYYAFTISPRTGIWHILKKTPAALEVIQEGQVNSLKGLAPPGFSPDEDQIDSLRVDARADEFLFHINNEPVAYFSDPDYANGEIGFFDENFEETLSHIHYNVFTIREIEFDESTAQALASAGVPQDEAEPTQEAESTQESEAAPTEQASDALPTSEPEEATEESAAEPEATAANQTPTSQPEAEPTNTPEPTPTGGPDISGMILVPAGYFLMGSSTGQPDETPEHPVLLDAFYLDEFEVTNAQYRTCVEDGGCTASATADSFTYQGYRDSTEYDDYPVISVNWDQANAYCQWADKRLPTEAEWEYAAAGPDNFTWPWGNTFDAALSAASAPDTQPVGSFPNGVSPFNIHDMAGNVNEWVADDFDETFYANSPAGNPLNDSGGAGRIYRGGSFDNPNGAFYTTSRRYGNVRSFAEVDLGFRCAASAADSAPSASLVEEFCQIYADYKPEASCP